MGEQTIIEDFSTYTNRQFGSHSRYEMAMHFGGTRDDRRNLTMAFSVDKKEVILRGGPSIGQSNEEGG